MCIRLCLDLLPFVRISEPLEAIPKSIMILLILEELIDKVSDPRSKSIIIILPISIDQNIPMFEGSLITVYRYLLDILPHLR